MWSRKLMKPCKCIYLSHHNLYSHKALDFNIDTISTSIYYVKLYLYAWLPLIHDLYIKKYLPLHYTHHVHQDSPLISSDQKWSFLKCDAFHFMVIINPHTIFHTQFANRLTAYEIWMIFSLKHMCSVFLEVT